MFSSRRVIELACFLSVIIRDTRVFKETLYSAEMLRRRRCNSSDQVVLKCSIFFCFEEHYLPTATLEWCKTRNILNQISYASHSCERNFCNCVWKPEKLGTPTVEVLNFSWFHTQLQKLRSQLRRLYTLFDFTSAVQYMIYFIYDFITKYISRLVMILLSVVVIVFIVIIMSIALHSFVWWKKERNFIWVSGGSSAGAPIGDTVNWN
mgnify:FL=1